jgi:hypothetical protein
MLKVIGVSFVVVVLILALANVIKDAAVTPSNPAQAAAKAAEESKWETALGGAVTLQRRMRNPESFKVSKVLEMSSGSVCYEYRAQNGFGGMNAGSAIVYQNHLLDESVPGFGDVWARECAGKLGVEKGPEINYALRTIAARE